MRKGPFASPVIQAVADHGMLCTFGDRIDAGLSRQIAALTDALVAESIPGIVDLVPSYTTLLVLLEPGGADLSALTGRIQALWTETEICLGQHAAGNEVVIPVRYGGADGPDLSHVAQTTGLSEAEVVRRHAEAVYQVGAIGFSPGFAFLIGLPPELTVPRRSRPRTAVPPGSVGIGGAQTGIYSLETPGGWSLIGRTAERMFDPDRDPPSLLQTGDTVRFVVASGDTGSPPSHALVRRAPGARPGDAVEVLEPGLQTSVQDLGRPGHGRLGVAPGGAADRGALVRGNELLGNPHSAAGLEIALVGPRLRFLRPGRIVITGADLGACLNGMRLLVDAVRVVGPGDELAFARTGHRGARAFLCIRGGIDVPLVLGSRSTDLTAGFGGFQGRALHAGDRLRVGTERRGGDAPVVMPAAALGNTFRVMRGPQDSRFDEEVWTTFVSAAFTVSSQSNRLGIRLDGPPIRPSSGADIISEGMMTGNIQVTGEGQPIVMLPARATIGGYPKIATVIAADLDRLGQLRPGDRIRFQEVEPGLVG